MKNGNNRAHIRFFIKQIEPSKQSSTKVENQQAPKILGIVDGPHIIANGKRHTSLYLIHKTHNSILRYIDYQINGET